MNDIYIFDRLNQGFLSKGLLFLFDMIGYLVLYRTYDKLIQESMKRGRGEINDD